MDVLTALTPQDRAIFDTSLNVLKIEQSEVPAHRFDTELAKLLDPAQPSGVIPLDLSGVLHTDTPATTPMLLVRYVLIRAGESVTTDFRSSGEVYCVMSGSGTTRSGDCVIAWGPGDVFSLPGLGDKLHMPAEGDAVLCLVTDEPVLALLHLEPSSDPAIQPAHYPWARISEQLDFIYSRTPEELAKAAGKAVRLTTTCMGPTPVTTPMIAATINTLEPGGAQRPHRHNAAAITLCLEGDGVYTVADDVRVDWKRWSVMITPPTSNHAHFNDGDKMMVSLSIHDAGIYYRARTEGFSFG